MSAGKRKRTTPLQAAAILAAVLWFGVLILLPIGVIVYKAFENGAGAFLAALVTPEARHAFRLTLIITAASVAVNTLIGLPIAFALARYRLRLKTIVDGLVNLPLAVSPIVAGLMFLLLVGRIGWFGGALEGAGIKIAFALPGMIIATMFVSLPFVVREVVPVLEEVGTEGEEAAATLGAGRLQTFFRVTLPAMRWGLIYGMTLTTARAMGEFGAVMIISGNIIRKTQTVPLHINQALADFDYQGAYSSALVLAAASFVILIVVQTIYQRKKGAENE
jgi:sulfate transport system permease protein